MADLNVLNDAPDSKIIAAIEDNLFQSWIAMGQIPSVDLYSGNDKIQFISGLNFPICNGVFKARLNSENLDEQVESTLAPFKKRNLPMFWWTGPATLPENLNINLESHGLKHADSWPGMSMKLSDLPKKDLPPGLIIRPVSNMGMLRLWNQPFTTVFEMPGFVTDFFANIFQYLGFEPDIPFRNYIGLLNDEPVACATVFYGAGVAGIYNIATLEKFRGRGIGTAITTYPLLQTLERGYRYGILHSSHMGFQVYSKIGFKEYCKVHAYFWQPEETTD
jgi:GNAT superfamily N-acetyltransferase